MDAELSQKAAQLMTSPFWKQQVSVITDSAQYSNDLISRLEKAQTFKKLTPRDKTLFELAERSMKVAKDMEFYPPYSADELTKILDKVTEGMPLAEDPALNDEDIEIDFLGNS